MHEQVYRRDKLEELIVYACEQSRDDRFFGVTKLNKILFYSDFTSYRETGQSITGAKYQHLKQGPCPQQMRPVLDDLEARGRIETRVEQTYVGRRSRPIANKAADRDVFKTGDLQIVDEVMQQLAGHTAAQVSELSHQTMAWRLTQENQEIPYGTALLDESEPTDEDLLWLRGVGEGERVEFSSVD